MKRKKPPIDVYRVRLEHQITQHELARLSGLSASVLSLIERGMRPVRAVELIALHEAVLRLLRGEGLRQRLRVGSMSSKARGRAANE